MYADHFPACFIYIKKVYVFWLLHFLISIDEFRAFQVLLQYTFFYLVETMRRSPRECVTSQTPNTCRIWRRSLCIPIEDTAKAPLCLSLWQWDLFLRPSSLLRHPHTMRLAFLAFVGKWPRKSLMFSEHQSLKSPHGRKSSIYHVLQKLHIELIMISWCCQGVKHFFRRRLVT